MKKTAFLMMAIALVTLTSCDANFWEGMAQGVGNYGMAARQQNVYNSYLYNAASYQPVSTGSSYVASSTSSSSSKTRRQCYVCKGTGRTEHNSYAGGNYSKYCTTCGKTVYTAHSHITCTSCRGKGYSEY
jgi:RecJ-like exonuclease